MADELSELRQENKRLTQQVSVLEQTLSQYQSDGPRGFFDEMNRWVVNATEYIKKKSAKIDDLVTGEGKDFERMMVLIKNTKESVETLASLRATLGIKEPKNGDEAKPIPPRTTPESIADVLGDNKQQQA